MICYPNAKINLGLKVLSQRTDGFHNLSSYFIPIPLYDILEVNIVDGLDDNNTITYSGCSLNSQSTDLVLQAYELLDNDFNLPKVNIHLHKNIPIGSGLGGGSSNATFMLMLLNELCDLKLTKDQFLKYANNLGSDCTFFLFNTFSLASGVGDVLQPIDFSFNDYYIVVLKPDFECSTKDIFSRFKLKKNKLGKSFSDFSIDSSDWQKVLSNDFESIVFSLHPILKKLKKNLYDSGAIYSGMTGSGASVYGLFKTPPKINNLDSFWKWECSLKGAIPFKSIF